MNEQKENVPQGHEEIPDPFFREQITVQITSVCAAVAAILLLSILFQLLIVEIVGSAAPSLAKQGWFAVAASSVPMYLFAMPLSYLVFRLGKKHAPSAKEKLSFGSILGLLVLAFGVAMIGSWIGSAVQAVLSLLTGKPVINPVAVVTGATPFWANLVFLGILAPIAEEIVYRKLVIDRLRPLGDLAAVILSGLLFGLIHGNFSQFFYAALFGILAGFVYVHTGKLRYTVIMHMAVNLIGGVFSAELLRALGDGTAEELSLLFAERPMVVALYLGYSLLTVASVVLTPIVLFLWRKRIASLKKASDPAPARVVGLLIRQPAVWALAVMMILLFLI